jgi:hypothetical protein
MVNTNAIPMTAQTITRKIKVLIQKRIVEIIEVTTPSQAFFFPILYAFLSSSFTTFATNLFITFARNFPTVATSGAFGKIIHIIRLVCFFDSSKHFY